jgi:hypothetical protein
VTNSPSGGDVWGGPPPPPGGGPSDGGAWSAPYGPAFGSPNAPRRPPRSSLATTGDVVAGVVAAAVMLVAGIPLGLLWGATAPKVDVADLLNNSAETALEAQPAADARFALIAAVFGIVAGLFAVWRGRRAGWPLPVGLLLGGLGGSLIAGQVGHLLESDKVLKQVPATANPLLRQVVDVGVRADGVHAAYPLLALLVFLVLVALTTRAEPLSVPSEPSAGSWWSAPR